MIHLLTSITPLAETLIPGEWLTGIVVAIITAIGAAVGSVIIAWKKGNAEGRKQSVSVAEPVPTVPTRKVYSPPSWDQHQALMGRVETLEATTIELRRDQADMFRQILQAGAERENRLAEKIDHLIRKTHERIDQQFQLMVQQSRPQTRRTTL